MEKGEDGKRSNRCGVGVEGWMGMVSGRTAVGCQDGERGARGGWQAVEPLWGGSGTGGGWMGMASGQTAVGWEDGGRAERCRGGGGRGRGGGGERRGRDASVQAPRYVHVYVRMHARMLRSLMFC